MRWANGGHGTLRALSGLTVGARLARASHRVVAEASMSEFTSGIWHNEHGSELVFEVGPEGRISGKFRTGVGFGRDATYDVIGTADGDLIAFSVRFGKLGAITSWVGHMVPDGSTLETLWHMTIRLAHPRRTDETWKGVWSGADTFRRGPATETPRPWQGNVPVPLWIE
jgi:hypothetical protein